LHGRAGAVRSGETGARSSRQQIPQTSSRTSSPSSRPSPTPQWCDLSVRSNQRTRDPHLLVHLGEDRADEHSARGHLPRALKPLHPPTHIFLMRQPLALCWILYLLNFKFLFLCMIIHAPWRDASDSIGTHPLVKKAAGRRRRRGGGGAEGGEQEVVWVGLRPGRTSGPRIETELLPPSVPQPAETAAAASALPYAGAGAGEAVRVVHCYGHGGCGVTLSMGCAEAVLRSHLAPFLPPPPLL
jgi:hypothetical protein